MQTVELPETVLEAWGTEVARDFVAWLDERLQTTTALIKVQVSAYIARQKVNVLMLEQVSNLLLAGEPVLIGKPSGDWVWRVPVDMTFPTYGRIGRVGELEVDAYYGRVRYTEALLAQIAARARQLAQQVSQPDK